jgi:predicted nucleic acid-binding protein
MKILAKKFTKILNKNMSEYILDACVLVALLAGEKSAPIFAQILDSVFEGKAKITANSVNLGEFYYSALKYQSADLVEAFLQDLIGKFNLEIINPTFEDCLESAKIKSGGGIAYLDCFNLVLAKKRILSKILTLDKEYEKFANQYNIQFL